MNSILEALPEFAISLVVFMVFLLIAKSRLSAKTIKGVSIAYIGTAIVVLVMLFQSGTPPSNTLQVNESFAEIDTELAEQKDLSPKTLTEEESSKRLNTLIEEQKESVSLTVPKDKKKNDNPD